MPSGIRVISEHPGFLQHPGAKRMNVRHEQAAAGTVQDAMHELWRNAAARPAGRS